MNEAYKAGGPLPNSIGAMADLYADVRDLRLGMEKAADAVKERETEIHKMILSALLESPDSGAAGEKYRVQLVKKTFYNAKDWPAFHAFVRENGMFELLQKRLSDTAVKDLMEQAEAAGHKGWVPPGVEKAELDALSFSKVG
jgi:hypothetical protein